MVIEIEAKFRLKCSFEEVFDKIQVLKPIFIDEYLETDTYFNHPCRDFGESDEALRLRIKCSSSGKLFFLTYKSGRVPGEYLKKRLEYEVAISDSINARNILSNLGFIETIMFSKERIVYRVSDSYLYLDNLFGIGLFIEIEGSEEDIVYITSLIKDCVEKVNETYLEICLDKGSCIVIDNCV